MLDQSVLLCGAQTRAGRPCRRLPPSGQRRCHLHGGQARRGRGSPRFKHGLYSSYSANRIVRRRQQCVAIKSNGERCRQWTQQGGRCYVHRTWPLSEAELDHLLAQPPRWLLPVLKRQPAG